MIVKTFYELDFGSLSDNQFVFFDTLKSLKTAIKKAIDDKKSFEVCVIFTAKFKHVYPFDIRNQIYGYNASKDSCYNFNLAKNCNYNALRRYERQISPIVKTHGFKK